MQPPVGLLGEDKRHQIWLPLHLISYSIQESRMPKGSANGENENIGSVEKKPKNQVKTLQQIGTDFYTYVGMQLHAKFSFIGFGKPWAEVALCTPPDIGVLKSPALVPPPTVLPCDTSRGVTIFAILSL
nr:hypothetical protein Iba_chr03bCG17150 [Ipomoea batatas]